MFYQSKASGNQETMAGLLRFKLQLFDWKCPSNQRRTTCNMKGLSILCWRLGRRVRSTYQMTRLKPGCVQRWSIYQNLWPCFHGENDESKGSGLASATTKFTQFCNPTAGSRVPRCRSSSGPARKLSTSPRPGDWNPTAAAKKTIGWDLPHWHRSRGSFLSAWD